ncbi:hypothetical protein Tco_0900707 [Tanacetum coccineum]
MGLWYPKDTDFYLTAFLDLDHAGCLDSRKSTFGGIKFLGGDKLVVKEAGLQFNVFSRNRELAEKDIVELFFVGIEYQLADIFTKALPEDRSYALSWKPCQGDSLNLPDHRAQVDQESQIKMIQVKEMMQDNDLKNSKSKDKGSRSRSQSMNEQSHYKQDKTKNKANSYKNVIDGTEEFEERDLNIGGDC